MLSVEGKFKFPPTLENLKESVQRGIQVALSPRQLAYPEVTQLVIERTRRILTELAKSNPDGITNRDIELGTLAAAFHDYVREIRRTKDEKAPHFRTNVYLSAEMARRFMEVQNKKHNEHYVDAVFSDQDKSLIEAAILGTTAQWNTERNTVEHPYVVHTNPLSRALTLASVGVYGMDPEHSLEEATLRYRNKHPQLAALFTSDMPAQKESENIAELVRDFAESHLKFAEGRKAMFDSYEKYWFAPRERGTIRELFSGFDRSIAIAKAFQARIKNMSAQELRKEMGY